VRELSSRIEIENVFVGEIYGKHGDRRNRLSQFRNESENVPRQLSQTRFPKRRAGLIQRDGF
jgi:hypothetical protein